MKERQTNANLFDKTFSFTKVKNIVEQNEGIGECTMISK